MIGFVINPQSGNGKGHKIWRIVKQHCEGLQLPFIFRVTTKSLEASSLAAEWVTQQSVTRIVVIGGDGTLHEVVQGIWPLLREGRTCSIGLIPAGTGNDFAKSHRIPNDPLRALHLIMNQPHEMKIDLITDAGSGDFVAFNSVGVGFDGAIANEMLQSKSKQIFNRFGLGSVSYFITMFRMFWTYRPTKVWLDIDGNASELEHTWFVVTTNVAYFGGGMQICPPARADDGMLDVVIVQSRRRLPVFPLMLKVYRGKHVGHPAVHLFRGQHIHVRAQEALHAQADGEAAKGTPLHVKIAPAALRILAGAM